MHLVVTKIIVVICCCQWVEPDPKTITISRLSTRMHVLVTGLLVFFLLLTVNCYHTTDGGWISLLEQNSGHGHFSDQHFKDFSWRPEPEPVDVNGNLLNFDHSESDFTSYFNEDYTSNRRNEDYASSRKNSSRKVE